MHKVVRRALTILALLSAVPLAAGTQERPTGGWQIRASTAEELVAGAGEVHLMLQTRGLTTMHARLSEFTGLSVEQLGRPGREVRFALRQDAGTFHFTGDFDGKRGRGSYEFEADPEFARALQSRGIAGVTEAQLYSLAMHRVGMALVDELRLQGYELPSARELVNAGLQGADVAYVKELAAAGVRPGNVRTLIYLRVHSVDARHVDRVRALGYTDLSPAALVRLRDQPEPARSGVGPGAAASPTPLAGRWTLESREGALGLELFWDDGTNWRTVIGEHVLRGSSPSQLRSGGTPVTFRIEQDAGTFVLEGRSHGGRAEGSFGFTPDRSFTARLRAAGVLEMRELRDHDLKNLAFGGLSLAAVAEYRALGLQRLTLDDLIGLAIRQVTPDYVRSLQDAGMTELNDADVVVELRMHGISAPLVRQLAASGHASLTPQRVLELRQSRR